MLGQNSSNHALTWFIAQIRALQDQIPIASFSDVDFLRKVNTLMDEIADVDIDIYFPSYQNIDNFAVFQMFEYTKNEAQRIRFLLRRIALETTLRPEDDNLLKKLLISLHCLNISLLQLNNELNSDYYLPLFSYFQTNAE
jgi:hypothetical protein